MGDFIEKLRDNYIIILAIILGIVSFLLLTVPFIQTLDNVPANSVTYDVFFNSLMANAVHETGQFRLYPDYRAWGVSDAVIADPPLVFSIPATMSMLSSVPTYPMFTIVLALFQVFTALSVFVLLKKYFNGPIAIMALAIAAVPATSAWLFQYYIGFTSSLEAFAFTAFILFFTFLTLEKRSILAEVLVGGAFGMQMMLHGPAESGYIMLFLGLIYAYSWWKNKSWSIIFSGITLVLSAIIFSSYQYILLRLARLTQTGLSSALFEGNPIPDYFPRPDVHWILIIFAILGVFIVLQKIWTKKFSDKKIFICLFLVFVTIIILSFLIGIDGSRSMRQLYNLYPFLALLPALGLYSLYQLFKSKISDIGMILIYVVTVGLIVILSFQTTFAELSSVSAAGQYTTSRWQALEWVANNTPSDSRVFYLYGFEHEFETFGERIPYKGDMGLGFTQVNMIQLCQGIYPETYNGDWGASLLTKNNPGETYYYPVIKSFLNFEFKPSYIPGTNEPMITPRQNISMKYFDYVVAQYKGTQADPCVAFFVNQSMERGHQVAWFNDQFVIVEVNHERTN